MKKIMMTWLCVVAMIQAVNIGDTLPQVTLEKENGGTSNDKPWHATSLKGKVHVVLYMDPDERKGTQPLLDALNQLDVDPKAYSTIAIVNLSATWMPDYILESILSKKQKELKNTSFVFDKEKMLVKKWQMTDDASNILIVDKNSKILYQKVGNASNEEVAYILKMLSDTLK